MGDDVYQPTGNMEEQGDAAPLDLEDTLDERGYDDLLDECYSSPEKPLGVDRVGVTAAEQRDGETLDQRIAQEEPDITPVEGDGTSDLSGGEGEPIDPQAGSRQAGRLVAPEEGARPDTEKGPVASDIGVDGGAVSAEEAAVHLIPADDGDTSR
ncbi:DUF5709 domain-containing protein [Kitasatospora sp. NPDC056531]|uniref:DUF5709 domain-containing protein n=1 Tax=Kitasatospora sp. NPDC056531 TaxID=3345856 RepID=UPI0036AAFF61